jgi:hypothetical protein
MRGTAKGSLDIGWVVRFSFIARHSRYSLQRYVFRP